MTPDGLHERFVVQAQRCSKLWRRHILAGGTSYKEEHDNREGSVGMGILHVLQRLSAHCEASTEGELCMDDDLTLIRLDGQRSTGA